LQAPHLTTRLIEEDHFVRRCAPPHCIIRLAGQKNRTHLVRRIPKQNRVLACAVQKRAVITVTDLQYPLRTIRRHLQNPTSLPETTPPCHKTSKRPANSARRLSAVQSRAPVVIKVEASSEISTKP